jgi:transcriptional regulator with XRE-family HTH domain
MLPTADAIVAELKTWCAVERGRPSRVAEIVGANRSAVSRWLRGQRKPSLNQDLAIQEFLKREHRKFKKRGAA